MIIIKIVLFVYMAIGVVGAIVGMQLPEFRDLKKDIWYFILTMVSILTWPVWLAIEMIKDRNKGLKS